MNLAKKLNNYDYFAPSHLIATAPASPRDSARLLVFDRKKDKISFDTFSALPKYLPKNAVLVFNDTKVIPARLVLAKDTGGRATASAALSKCGRATASAALSKCGRVRVLYIKTEGEKIIVIADRKLHVGSTLFLNNKIHFAVTGQTEKFYILKPNFRPAELDKILDKYGITPIPPYIKNTPLSEKSLRQKYQTVFAKNRGSVAAPTASLHFTERLLKRIPDHRFVTLHVNLGTFAPITEENLKTNSLHSEYFEIDKKTADFLNKAKRAGKPIIAVGTTAARTLESAAFINSNKKSKLKKLSGETNLFITPGYKFKFVNALITNFHVPKSSLLMLVSAFIGRKKTLSLYDTAIKKEFRLFSFGDGMLLL